MEMEPAAPAATVMTRESLLLSRLAEVTAWVKSSQFTSEAEVVVVLFSVGLPSVTMTTRSGAVMNGASTANRPASQLVPPPVLL